MTEGIQATFTGTVYTLENAADAIASTVWAIDDLLEAKTVWQFANAVKELQDIRGQLGSWHPRWDEDHGYIPGREDDEEESN